MGRFYAYDVYGRVLGYLYRKRSEFFLNFLGPEPLCRPRASGTPLYPAIRGPARVLKNLENMFRFVVRVGSGPRYKTFFW